MRRAGRPARPSRLASAVALAVAGLALVPGARSAGSTEGGADVAGPVAGSPAAAAPRCAPGGPAVVLTGQVGSGDAKTYRVLPFEVVVGTTRVEVGYSWTDDVPLPSLPVNLVQTVFDLGLWDADGVGTPEGFRGWSGSRQGKVAEGQDPVWVQADTAERGYRPGPVEPGTWNVDLGIAAVSPFGASYEVTVRCLDPVVGEPFVAQPVDATHVADPEPGWYHADFHMHGHHSHPQAPEWDGFVQYARDAGLDVLAVTDYVTNQHHRELGPVQEANPDLLIWPSREVITYHGHATVFGETPHEVDWRHGAPGVSLGRIQARSVADGALFGVAHPTTFPTELFASFCRGCEFTLDGQIDWDQVDTMEVVGGPALVDDTQLGGPGLGLQVQNPFVLTALLEWQQRLFQGHRVTAVSGSDDKLGPGLGASATAIYASELSRPAIAEAVRAGHAYIRALGVHHSPALEMEAVTADGQRGIFGDTLRASSAQVTVRVEGGRGQLLLVTADGLPAGVVPITSDDFTHHFTATRSPLSGPLGTFWRVDTLALTNGTSSPYLSTIGNPIFLAAGSAPSDPGLDGEPADPPPDPVPTTPPPDDAGGDGGVSGAGGGAGRLPATGGTSGALLPAALAAVLVLALAATLRRTRPTP